MSKTSSSSSQTIIPFSFSKSYSVIFSKTLFNKLSWYGGSNKIISNLTLSLKSNKALKQSLFIISLLSISKVFLLILSIATELLSTK